MHVVHSKWINTYHFASHPRKVALAMGPELDYVVAVSTCCPSGQVPPAAFSSCTIFLRGLTARAHDVLCLPAVHVLPLTALLIAALAGRAL